ncbi:hypothetical protein AB0I81_51460 [Nonomuraea sp. NPDC050404]|uniref:hypothetical protein n=1 Tax=Nonomuraea sp. NPDC050404 TaxID=3155783 RepID=UPI0033C52A2B
MTTSAAPHPVAAGQTPIGVSTLEPARRRRRHSRASPAGRSRPWSPGTPPSARALLGAPERTLSPVHLISDHVTAWHATGPLRLGRT